MEVDTLSLSGYKTENITVDHAPVIVVTCL